MINEDNVIDNKKIKLIDELLKVLPKTDSASIAVGYFFISGFSHIINAISDITEIRLLISNTTDRTTAETLIEGFKTIKAIKSEIQRINYISPNAKKNIVEKSSENIARSLEFMNQTDQDQDVVQQLIEMMKNGKLKVRIYPKEKLHAKAYIFLPKDPSFTNGMGIVGSSNLSLAGLSHNSELNLKTLNSPDVKQLLDWFNGLWEESLEFTDDFQIILEKSWASKMYTPYEVYLKAVYHEVKDRIESNHIIDPVWSASFPTLFPFQKIAVDYALTMFEQYGGVIIGDVVGLGKTYVGTVILKYLQLEKYRPLIICPPHLIQMWEEFCAEYDIDAKVLSRGRLTKSNYEFHQDYKYKDRDLVLIDESHHFRNSSSRQYENLSSFMRARDAKGILLTATPLSNEADDIKNQVMLFHSGVDTNIPPANEIGLEEYFKKVKQGEANLVDFLQNIMIRRTRRYILKQWGITDHKNPSKKYILVGNKKTYFPKRNLSNTTYTIEKVYKQKYDDIVDKLKYKRNEKHLTLARYSPGLYLKEEFCDKKPYKDLSTSGPKLVALIRYSLLKRMESSLQAFQDSIRVYINTHKIFLKFLDEGKLPIGDLISREMYQTALQEPDFIDDPTKIEEIGEKLDATKYKIEAFKIDELTKDLQSDLAIFEEIEKMVKDLTYKTDDKLIKLQERLDTHSAKKILIFTEFKSTAKYLDKYVKWKGNKKQVDSTTDNNMDIIRRFDPENNQGSVKKEDQISLLISTDVLAEGVNLQAGEVVINYDFHWNPVRLIQRVGRVDRIGSKHDVITVENFFADPKIEGDFTLRKAVNKKIKDIQEVIGEDHQILENTEIVNEEDIYAIYGRNESIFDKDGNPLEPSRHEEVLTNIQKDDPELWNKFKKIPDGIRSCSSKNKHGYLLVACQSGSIKSGIIKKYYKIDTGKKLVELTGSDILNILENVKKKRLVKIPSNYNQLLSLGWNEFLRDVEQVQAREIKNPKLTKAQRWIIKKLIEISKLDEFKDKHEEINALRKAFQLPHFLPRVNKMLLKLKQDDPQNLELLDRLEQIYRSFELQKEVKNKEASFDSPRILYSIFVE